MSLNARNAYEALKALEGSDQGTGDWFEVSQDRIDGFADVTLDHQFIHVDPERAAAETPFGGTIAHGFLTLSLLVHLTASLPKAGNSPAGRVMGINYGFEKVRFISPVPAGVRIRARSVLSTVEFHAPNAVNTTRTVTVEIEGKDKPAMVADWVTRGVFA